MNDQIYLNYWSAQLWPRLFPIICLGDLNQIMDVYKFLKFLPQEDRIVKLLNEQCIEKFSNYGINHNFVY